MLLCTLRQGPRAPGEMKDSPRKPQKLRQKQHVLILCHLLKTLSVKLDGVRLMTLASGAAVDNLKGPANAELRAG